VKGVNQDYRISSELEQERFLGYEREMVWSARENQARVGNQRQRLLRSHTF
jgi:hypothetical protein